MDVEYFFYRLILDAYRVISMFLCGVMVRLWVVGFECDFGVVVRVRFITSFDVSNRLKMANRCGTRGKRTATLQETNQEASLAEPQRSCIVCSTADMGCREGCSCLPEAEL